MNGRHTSAVRPTAFHGLAGKKHLDHTVELDADKEWSDKRSLIH